MSSPIDAPSPANTSADPNEDPEDPSSNPNEDSADLSSSSSDNTFTSTHTAIPPKSTVIMSQSATQPVLPSSQKDFAIALNISLSKLPATVILGKNNYTHWAIGIKQSLRPLCLDKYLTISAKPNDITDEEHLANKECITNFLLNRMDASTSAFVESKIQTSVQGEVDLEYEPSKIWKIVRDSKAPMSEAAQFQLDNQLDEFRQDNRTTLEVHLAKFRELKDELMLAGGDLNDGQLARRLIKSLHHDNQLILSNVFDMVKPLTYDGVEQYILMKEKEIRNLPQFANLYKSQSFHPGAHSINRGNTNNRGGQYSRPKCTTDKCMCKYGRDECFENPKNQDKKRKWQQELINKGRWRGQVPSHLRSNNNNQSNSFQHRQSANIDQTTNTDTNFDELTQAMNSMNVSTDNNEPMVFHTDYFCSNKAVQAKIPSNGFGLADTGSSHHMFNNLKHFDRDSLVPNPDPNNRLNLAGGSDTLEIEKIGTAYLLDADGNVMKFENSLYVPLLNKNLIAAGALIKRGVVPTIHPTQPHLSTLNLGKKTLFKGFFSGNLMIVKLIECPVTLISPTSKG